MSDDIEFDAPDDDEVAPQQEAAQKRQAAAQRKAEKELQALNTELEELRAFKVEREAADRTSAVSSAFEQLGLNPKHAKFFSGEGEVTVDAVKAWAVQEDFLQPEEGEEAPAAAPTGYTPTVIEGSPVSPAVMPLDDWLKLSQSDPVKADQLWKAGRVAEAVRD